MKNSLSLNASKLLLWFTDKGQTEFELLMLNSRRKKSKTENEKYCVWGLLNSRPTSRPSSDKRPSCYGETTLSGGNHGCRIHAGQPVRIIFLSDKPDPDSTCWIGFKKGKNKRKHWQGRTVQFCFDSFFSDALKNNFSTLELWMHRFCRLKYKVRSEWIFNMQRNTRDQVPLTGMHPLYLELVVGRRLG